jgi:capsid protein
MSADAVLDSSTRGILRNRCRYEVANNSYARGMILTLAHDVIGTGPRLQLLTNDGEYNRRTEHEFGIWALMVNLAGKLRTLRMARAQDGEAFLYLFKNPALDHRVKLDALLVEADRVRHPELGPRPDEENTADGIIFDEFDNPVAYMVLKHHPGDDAKSSFLGNQSVRVEAKDMVHFYRMDRPGQHRGVPEITPALPLFAQLRRFTLAVLAAAESAADFAAILYTDCPADGEAEDVKPMGKVNLERNMMTTMPAG